MTPRRKSTIEYVTVSIRFPKMVYNMIVVDAEKNGRSFNQQVIYMIKCVLGLIEDER